MKLNKTHLLCLYLIGMMITPIQITLSMKENIELSPLSIKKPHTCDYELGVEANEPLYYNMFFNASNLIIIEKQYRMIIDKIDIYLLPEITYNGSCPMNDSSLPKSTSYEILADIKKWDETGLKWVKASSTDWFQVAPVVAAYDMLTNILMYNRGAEFVYPFIIPKNHMGLINDSFTYYDFTANYIDTYNINITDTIKNTKNTILNYTTDGILKKMIINNYGNIDPDEINYSTPVPVYTKVDLITTLDLNGNSVPSGNIIATNNGRKVTFQYNRTLSEINAGEAINCSWDFGDQMNMSTKGTKIIHEYETYGDYIVTLTVTDQTDDVGVFTYKLKVSFPVMVVVFIGIGAAGGIGFFAYRRFIRPKPRYDKVTQTYSCRQGFVYQDNKCVKISSTAGTATVSRLRKK